MTSRPINASPIILSRFKRSFPLIFSALMIPALCGCQEESAQDNLPPPRLTGPQISQGGYFAAPASASIPAPPNLPHSYVPPTARRFAAPDASAVPRGWIPQAPANRWIWIIIHHSDSAYGSAAIIDKWHRQRGFDELGYHFVIGNGTNSGDGQIEVGPRWTKQKWGAHDNALDNRFNTNGIGICLVGDFNNTHPTTAQRRSLIRLIVYLMKTYHINAAHVLGHGETKDTECPGRFLRASEIRASVAEIIARSGRGSDDYLAAGQ